MNDAHSRLRLLLWDLSLVVCYWNRWIRTVLWNHTWNFTLETNQPTHDATMLNLKQLVRHLVEEFFAPDPPRGAFMIVGIQEVVLGENMHVKLNVGIPLLTSHEKAQKVTTRNIMAIKNGAEDAPILALTGQDALTFTKLDIDNLQYGDKIELRMFNVDQAGNVSTTPFDAFFVLADTTPPDAPVGPFTINTVEVADPGDEDATAPPVAEVPPPAEGAGPSVGGGDDSSPPSGQ